MKCDELLKIKQLSMIFLWSRNKGVGVMTWGITTLECYECGKMHRLYGWLPTTLRIWDQDEGLLCCNIQTKLVSFEEGVKNED